MLAKISFVYPLLWAFFAVLYGVSTAHSSDGVEMNGNLSGARRTSQLASYSRSPTDSLFQDKHLSSNEGTNESASRKRSFQYPKDVVPSMEHDMEHRYSSSGQTSDWIANDENEEIMEASKFKNRIEVGASASAKQQNKQSEANVQMSSNPGAEQNHEIRVLYTSNPIVPNNTRRRDIDRGEQKVHVATAKLVKWLRNRLRKRLEDVSKLEKELTTEATLLDNLNKEIVENTQEREDEIRRKLLTKRELAGFRRHSISPDAELVSLQQQTASLSDQLGRLTDTYEAMTAKHRDLKEKIKSAGFSHWLDARGKEYLPETAVGVLSKSAQILGPVSNGLKKVVHFDDLMSREVEHVLPVSDDSIVGKVIWDMAMLVPLMPFLLFLRLANGMIHSLSIYDSVLYGSALLAAENIIMFFMSLLFGREVIGMCQKVNEGILIGLIFLNSFAFAVLFCSQGLIAGLRPSRTEALQVILLLTIGYRYFRNVFQPVMLNKPIMINMLSHLLYAVTFTMIFSEKKRLLNFTTPYDTHVRHMMLSSTQWVKETVEAMRNVFSDVVRNGSRARTEVFDGSKTTIQSLTESCTSSHCSDFERQASASVDSGKVSFRDGVPGYLGQNRWFEANRSASLIRQTFAASRMYGGQKSSAIGRTTFRQDALRRSGSHSDDSAVYQSCLEDIPTRPQRNRSYIYRSTKAINKLH